MTAQFSRKLRQVSHPGRSFAVSGKMNDCPVFPETSSSFTPGQKLCSFRENKRDFLNSVIGDLKMNPLISFLASPAGRIIRIVAGILLIAWGIMGLGGTVGIIVAVVGAVPLLAGIFDFCVFAPLFGNPFSGKAIRAGK
jgi:hypothetical protein